VVAALVALLGVFTFMAKSHEMTLGSTDIVWNRSRHTIDEPLTSTDHSIELTMKRVW
jgi:hypothetical protein